MSQTKIAHIKANPYDPTSAAACGCMNEGEITISARNATRLMLGDTLPLQKLTADNLCKDCAEIMVVMCGEIAQELTSEI